MHELLEVVADAVRRSGADASVHTGTFPDIANAFYVVIPHEYFVVTPLADQPSAALRARTIGLCVEHPGNQTFEISATHAGSLGGVMDINDDSVAELRRRGVPAERFVLGYSPKWDVWQGVDASPRPLDITYLGTSDVRRTQQLALQAEELSVWETRLLIPPHEPMTRSRQDFLLGRTKRQHLSATKVLINLHRGGSRSLEWFRVLEAMCNGCVVVSERSEDYEPLVPGEDVVFADSTRIVAAASALLRDPKRLGTMRHAAWAKCRSMDMRTSATRLIEMADKIAQGHRSSVTRVGPTLRQNARYPVVPEPPQPDSGMPALAPWASTLPEPLRRLQAALVAAVSHPGSGDVAVTEAIPAIPPNCRVSALIPDVAGDARLVSRTLRALEGQDVQVAAWVGRQTMSSTALPSGTPGVGACLNALLRETESEVILVLEPGHDLFPASVRRLLAALDESPEHVAGYGFMADRSDGALWNALPFEPERLARRAYLTVPFAIRRSALVALGGFATEPSIAGYEYYELWCRIADRGWTAAFVQQILGRGWRPRSDGGSIAAIAPEVTLEALRSPAPRTFAASSTGATISRRGVR